MYTPVAPLLLYAPGVLFFLGSWVADVNLKVYQYDGVGVRTE